MTDDNLICSHSLLNYIFKDSNLKIKSLSKDKFYKFTNTLLDCLPVFYENSINKINNSSDSAQTGIHQQAICCICDDNKSDVMLECCVKI